MEAKAGIAAWRTFLRRKELPRGRRSKEQKNKKTETPTKIIGPQ
jgi:hypothetical protein